MLHGMAKGNPDRGGADVIWKKGSQARFEVARIDAIEQVTKHDVIAFLTHLAEIVGPEARFVHQGMTSSDVLDTTLNVQLVRGGHSDRRHRPAAGGLEAQGVRTPPDAHDRTQPRHSRRTDDVRSQARLRLRGVRARAGERMRRRARTCGRARFRARWARSPTSIRGSRRSWRNAWG